MDEQAGRRELYQLICNIIAAAPQRRITFAQFMQLALYHPTYGYYTASAKIGGRGADFYTSPDVSPAFGQLIARQLAQCWELLGQPRPFRVVEQGAGVGRLAADIIAEISKQAGLANALEYAIVEISPTLRKQQRTLLFDAPVRWYDSLHQLAPLTGVLLSNELVDAFPVHIVVGQEGGKLQEVYVTNAAAASRVTIYNSPFSEVLAAPSTPALAEYFARLGIRIPAGNRAEVNLAMLEWMGEVATTLERGYVITIDYGSPADRLFTPRRTDGTLLCYYQHSVNRDPYTRIGQQDITAQVDFTSLQQAGAAAGLPALGLTNQAAFLTSLGLADMLPALPSTASNDEDYLRRRASLLRLIEMGGLGSFKVLVQGKGISAANLAGLKFRL